jgi:hypothetical protein
MFTNTSTCKGPPPAPLISWRTSRRSPYRRAARFDKSHLPASISNLRLLASSGGTSVARSTIFSAKTSHPRSVACAYWDANSGKRASQQTNVDLAGIPSSFKTERRLLPFSSSAQIRFPISSVYSQGRPNRFSSGSSSTANGPIFDPFSTTVGAGLPVPAPLFFFAFQVGRCSVP